jgi:hypothetical protein
MTHRRKGAHGGKERPVTTSYGHHSVDRAEAGSRASPSSSRSPLLPTSQVLRIRSTARPTPGARVGAVPADGEACPGVLGVTAAAAVSFAFLATSAAAADAPAEGDPEGDGRPSGLAPVGAAEPSATTPPATDMSAANSSSSAGVTDSPPPASSAGDEAPTAPGPAPGASGAPPAASQATAADGTAVAVAFSRSNVRSRARVSK